MPQENQNLDQLLKAVKEQLTKMSNPDHPAFKLVIERDGYGLDANQQPTIAAFHMKIEYLAAVVHLPVQGRSSLVLPTNMRGGPSPAEEPSAVQGIVGGPTEEAPVSTEVPMSASAEPDTSTAVEA